MRFFKKQGVMGLTVALMALVGSFVGAVPASANPGDPVYCTNDFDEPGCLEELGVAIFQPSCRSKVTIVLWNPNDETAPYTIQTTNPSFEGDEFAEPGFSVYQLNPSASTTVTVGYSYQELVFANRNAC